ncbi:RAMP superfamily CRISPR-associated protein [Candidatus Protofrankia californiensis]|uniref:RAMP superfamily CRISPR-associated protein n=1 Tax=Candidatus Protofrankia californiensis TaxID=1839754 RepID=UPI001040ED91|nr:RAMP superfamily CRISPR-associated protein [Candidatus Protofrankia californiensis]
MAPAPWIPVGVTVTTPMFLAPGPDARSELRMPGIRGAARFWFRALAAPVFGDDYAALARAESEVFGTAGGRYDETRIGPSPVALRLVRPPTLDPPPSKKDLRSPGWLRLRPDAERRTHGIGYLLGQGLFLPPSPNENREHPELARPHHIPAGATGTFAVRIGARDDPSFADYVGEVTGISLWALATFGGLGARVRRGFGGVGFAGLEQLCGVIGESTDAEPSRDHPAILRLHELVAERHGHRPLLRRSSPRPLGTSGAWPTAPTWARWHILLSKQTGSWPQLLHHAGFRLREFRAPVDRGPEFNAFKRWVTREYVDAVVPTLKGQHPDGRDFAIGSFGLPVVFGKDAEVKLRRGRDELRRASPLWIRVHQDPDGRCRLLYHVFEATIGPANATLDLETRRRPPEHLHLDEAMTYRTIAEFLATAP